MWDFQSYLDSLGPEKIKPGLERIKLLLHRLKNPQDEIKAILISGTNGKGSTLTYLSSVLVKAEYNTGSYTSPHFFKVNERIKINGKSIKDGELANALLRVKTEADKIGKDQRLGYPTYFEVLTAAAFLYLSSKKLDLCLIEVGIEGRFDATNVFTPICMIITNIEREHIEFLGEDLQKAAAETLNTLKTRVPLVTAEQKAGMIKRIKERCKETGSRLVLVGEDITFKSKGFKKGKQVFDYSGQDLVLKNLEIPLLGEHQLLNVCCSLGAIEVLKTMGFDIKGPQIRKGLKSAIWAGRFEIIKKNPLIIADGAHNPSGAKELSKALEANFPGKNIILVFGVLKDKEHEEIIRHLPSSTKMVIATEPKSARVLDAGLLKKKLKKRFGKVELIRDVSEAVKRAVEVVKEDEMICITGSLMTVAEALRQLTVNS